MISHHYPVARFVLEHRDGGGRFSETPRRKDGAEMPATMRREEEGSRRGAVRCGPCAVIAVAAVAASGCWAVRPAASPLSVAELLEPVRRASELATLERLVARWDPEAFRPVEPCAGERVRVEAVVERGRLGHRLEVAVVRISAISDELGWLERCEGHWLGVFDERDGAALVASAARRFGPTCSFWPVLEVEWTRGEPGLVLVAREHDACGTLVSGTAERTAFGANEAGTLERIRLEPEHFAHSRAGMLAERGPGEPCDDEGGPWCGPELACRDGRCAPPGCTSTADCAFGFRCEDGGCTSGCRRSAPRTEREPAGCGAGSVCLHVDAEHEMRGVGRCGPPPGAASPSGDYGASSPGCS